MIRASTIRDVARELYQRAITNVPKDVLDCLRKALEQESSERARKILETCLRSAELARQNRMVVCQDTGLPVFFIRYGMRTPVSGDIRSAVAQAVSELTTAIPLRPMAVHPLTRDRPIAGVGKGVPIVRFEVEPELDYIEITALPKGAGCGYWSSAKMMPYLRNEYVKYLREFVVDCVLVTEGQACPPYVVGIGLGGTLEEASLLAERATLRPLNQQNPESELAAMEEEFLVAINSTGIGPMGLGGDTTALRVNIEYAYTHTPWNPIAVDIQCWPNRKSSARIHDDQKITYI
jgi:fumarate hydratase subunit alpha